MVHKILFWSGFGTFPKLLDTVDTHTNPSIGVAVRLWQLGIEMRPFFNKEAFWVYPIYAAAGGSFGYWLTGVEERQYSILYERRDNLLEKRRRRAEREGTSSGQRVEAAGVHEGAVGTGGTGANKDLV